MFDYGDNIRIIINAPERFKPGEFGSIVGIVGIENEYLSEKYDIKIGIKCYYIEFIAGSDLLVPEEYLEFDIED